MIGGCANSQQQCQLPAVKLSHDHTTNASVLRFEYEAKRIVYRSSREQATKATQSSDLQQKIQASDPHRRAVEAQSQLPPSLYPSLSRWPLLMPSKSQLLTGYESEKLRHKNATICIGNLRLTARPRTHLNQEQNPNSPEIRALWLAVVAKRRIWSISVMIL